MTEQCSTETKRLAWLCRRGMREMDILLGGFFDQHYQSLDATQQKAFGAMLEQADLDILDWLYGRKPAPSDFQGIIALLQKQNENVA